MKQLLACLALISVLVSAGIVYPQGMEVYAVDEGAEGNYTVTLRSSRGVLYGVDTDSDNWAVGELAAVLMYDSMTPNDISDDAALAIRHTGFFNGGGSNEK